MAIRQLQMHVLLSMEGPTRFISGHPIVISTGGRDFKAVFLPSVEMTHLSYESS